MEHTCAKCNKPGATKRCSKCKVQHYCGEQCQKLDWKNHKMTCSKPVAGAASNVADEYEPVTQGPSVKAYCSNCYSAEALHNCDHCPRKYCSPECKTEDFEKKGHQHFCCRSGEQGTDYEIRDSPDKQGLGVFALRDFKPGDIVMVEKPLFIQDSNIEKIPAGWLASQPGSVVTAIGQLGPPDGTIDQKNVRNRIGVTTKDGKRAHGLLITMSRVNHDCIGNTSHRYLPEKNLVLLQAYQAVSAGQEITFPYVPSAGRDDRQERLVRNYGFECKCMACTDPGIGPKLERVKYLDDAILRLGRTGRSEDSISAALELVSVYEELHCSPELYHRTYSDLFQVMMWTRKPLEECREVARKANRNAEMWYEECESEIQDTRAMVADPRGYFVNNCLGFGL